MRYLVPRGKVVQLEVDTDFDLAGLPDQFADLRDLPETSVSHEQMEATATVIKEALRRGRAGRGNN